MLKIKISPIFLSLLLLSFDAIASTPLFHDGAVGIVVQKINGSFICTGTLISNRTVLTAGHCLVDAISARVTHSYSLNRSAKWYSSQELFVHPEYDQNFPYQIDIGMILLKKDLDGVKPFSVEAFEMKAYENLYRIGFGGRNENPEPRAPTRLTNKRTLITLNPESFFTFGLFIGVSDTYGTVGDSGGPIYTESNGEPILIGVHSGRALDSSGLLVDISHFTPITQATMNWIRDLHSEISPQ